MWKEPQQENNHANLDNNIIRLREQLEEEKAKNLLLENELNQLKQTNNSSFSKKEDQNLVAQEFDHFINLSIPAWQEDFSEAANFIQKLEKQGITDLKNYFDDHPVKFIDLIKEIKICHLNKAAEPFTDKKQVSLYDLFKPDSYLSIIEQFNTILKKESKITSELTAEKTDGEKKYYIIKWLAIEPEKNNYSRVVVTLINITDRRLVENKLQETNRQLSTLIGNLNGIVYECRYDVNWTMLFISNTVYEITGYRTDELLYNKEISFAEFIHPEDIATINQQVSTSIQNNERFTIEYRIKTKSGEEKWLWEQGIGIRDAAGNVDTLEGYILDITDRKKTEIALREGEAKFKRIFQASPTIILLTSIPHGRILEANETFENIVGWKKEEYHNKTTQEINLWENKKDREEYIQLLTTNGFVKNKEYNFRLKTGEIRHALVSGHILNLHTGTVILGVFNDITDQKNTNEKLNNERIHLKTVIETIPDLIWLKDLNGLFLNCNNQFEKFLGAKEKDIIGKTDYDFVDKKSADFFRMNDKAAMKAQKPTTNQEWVTFASDNRRVLLETTKTPMYAYNNQLIGVLGMARDITKNKQNEEALQQSENLYKAIFNNTGTAACIINNDRILTLVNDKFVQLSGFSKNELENKSKLTDFVQESDLERMQHYHGERRKVGQQTPKQYEFIFIDRHEKPHHILLNIDVIPGTTMSVASLLDISLRVNALNEMKQSHEKYQNLIENINDVVFEIDRNWNFSYVSPSIQILTGYSVNSYIGQPYYDIIVPEDLNKLKLNFDDLLGTEIIQPIEFRIKTRDNRLVWIRSSARPIWDNKSRMIGARGLGINITNQKATELELIKAKEDAEKADRLKSAFLATMSHELRTPLNAIIGFSQLMDETVSKENMLEMGEVIFDSGNHLLSIIESIFELTMLQSKQSILKTEPFLLHDLFKNLRFFLESELNKIERTNIIPLFSVFETTPHMELMTDKTKLTQLLINFISNAVKYTHHGSIEVGCTIDKKDITLYVKDDGIGISPDKKDVIFERFRQVDETSTRKYGGVGLGLAICKEVSELLNGKIWVDSEPGVGSTFYFYLPDVIINRLED